jgi:hypothetical protein
LGFPLLLLRWLSNGDLNLLFLHNVALLLLGAHLLVGFGGACGSFLLPLPKLFLPTKFTLDLEFLPLDPVDLDLQVVLQNCDVLIVGKVDHAHACALEFEDVLVEQVGTKVNEHSWSIFDGEIGLRQDEVAAGEIAVTKHGNPAVLSVLVVRVGCALLVTDESHPQPQLTVVNGEIFASSTVPSE